MRSLFLTFQKRSRLAVFYNAFFLCVVSLMLFLTPKAMAGEQIFGYTYTTDTLPKNKWELEQWYWGRYGKIHGVYANSVYRTELEYGVTDNYQVAFYTNEKHVYANNNNRDRTTGGEGVPDAASPDKRFNGLTWEGISFEQVYRFLSPYKDPLGAALYFESSFGPDSIELEPKILLQKNFMEDRLVAAYNFVWELEWEKEMEDVWATESAFENDLGISYRFAPRWWAGLEFRNNQKVGSFNLKDLENSAFFLGPNIHYGGDRFWTSATVLFQLPFAVGYTEEQRLAKKEGRFYGNEFESVEFRLKVGCAFG